MAGAVDPTKEAFAAFRADAGRVQSICSIWSNCALRRPIRTGVAPTGAVAYAAYGRESEPVFSRLGGIDRRRGAFEQMLIGPMEERWDLCFIAQYPDCRRLRRYDPRSCLPRSGQAPAGWGGGFAPHPSRAGRGRRWLRLNLRTDESHRNRLPLA
jgi:hypothetical protein